MPDGQPIDWKTVPLEQFAEIVPAGWEQTFKTAQPLFREISKTLQKRAKTNIIYPPMPLVFNAFESLKPDQIKVVLIGQDPYFNPGEAMGWSFSVPTGVRVPPSLANMFGELADGAKSAYDGRRDGNLQDWVSKGVFLYNACLTVDAGAAKSHGSLWDDFSEIVIKDIAAQQRPIAWILLGKPAAAFGKMVNNKLQKVFYAGHPSPLNSSPATAFRGCGIFLAVEKWFAEKNIKFNF